MLFQISQGSVAVLIKSYMSKIHSVITRAFNLVNLTVKTALKAVDT